MIRQCTNVLWYIFSETYLAGKLAWRNVTRSKYRSSLLILGILFTVALETGIVISVDTLYDDFLLDHRNQNLTDISVTHTTEWKNVSELYSIVKEIKRVSNVYKASAVYYCSLNQLYEDRQGSGVLLFAVDSSSHPDMSSIKIIDGTKRISGSEVIISERIAQQGFQVGQLYDVAQYLPLEYGVDTLNIKIAGVMKNEPFFANKVGFLFILCDLDYITSVLPEKVQSSLFIGEIDIQVSDFLLLEETSIEIEDLLGVQYNVFVQKSISEIEAIGIRAYQTAMNLVVMASFLVEFLFITNVLAIAIKDRSKEIGVLRAIGSGSRQLIQTIATEIMFYSIIGCTFGIIFGLVFSYFLVGTIDFQYSGIEFQEFSIHTSSIVATYLSGIIVALISGLYPIFLALNVPVVQNIHSQMRSQQKFQVTKNWKSLAFVGLLMSIVGFSLQFYVGPSRFLDFDLLSIHFLVILMIFFGTLIVEAAILMFLPKIGMKVLRFFDIVTRTISMRNISREFQKSVFTILTAGMALTFIIIVGLTSAAVISSVPSYFQEQWGGIDIVCQASDLAPKNTSFSDTLESSVFISESSFIQEKRTAINGSINTYIYGVDPIRYERFSEQIILSESVQSPAVILSENRTNCLISDLLYDKLRVPLGSNLTLMTLDNRTINLTVSAVIKANVFLGNGEYLYISYSRFQDFFNTTFAKWFVCSTEQDIYSTQIYLESKFPELNSVVVIDFYMEAIEYSLQFQSLVFQVLFVESFILAAIAQFVCILVSTIRMEREMGIMRSMGLTKRGVLNVFMAESIALGLSALLIGTIDGIIGSGLLSWYISLSIPVSLNSLTYIWRILFWVIISFLITLISTIVPAWRSSTKNVVDTISGRPKAKKLSDSPIIIEEDVIDLPFWASNASSYENVPTENSSITESKTRPSLKGSTGLEKLKVKLYPFYSFITERKTEVLRIAVFFLAITTVNYIFDPMIIVRGINPFDFYWRIPFKFYVLSLTVTLHDYFTNINPLLLFVSLSSIGFVAHYLYYGSIPEKLMRNLFGSLLLGILGLFAALITYIIGFLIAFGATMLLIFVFGFKYSTTAVTMVGLVFLLSLVAVFFYLIHYIWVLLVCRGLYPQSSLKNQLLITRKIVYHGRTRFYVLVFIHLIIQVILTNILVKFVYSDYYWAYSPLPLDPIAFLILSFYEVSYFLLLLLYQIRQIQHFQSQSDLELNQESQ